VGGCVARGYVVFGLEVRFLRLWGTCVVNLDLIWYLFAFFLLVLGKCWYELQVLRIVPGRKEG
jgi:hypothetical protein